MSPAVFDPGLESITVAETELSKLDGENGELLIGGYPVTELAANASYEEAVYLLIHDRLPTDGELDSFRADLGDRRGITEEVRQLLRRAAAEEWSAMAALRMGAAAANLGAARDDPQAQAHRLIAVFPTLVGTYWRYRQGREPLEPRADLGHAANYYWLLTGTEPTGTTRRGLETFLTTFVEHGLNASTFAARVVASTESDLVSAVTAATGALKGSRHGGGLAPVFEMVQESHDADDTEAYLRDRLDSDDPVHGFGHTVYRVQDPRTAVVSAAAERVSEAAPDWDLLDTVREIERVGVDLLGEQDPQRQPEPTVELYIAALLDGIGIPPALFGGTFAVSRVGGWVAHALEQRATDTLVRPTGRYVGDTDGTWTPIGDRVGDDRLLQAGALEPISETLAVISEPARLEILLALFDRETVVPYSTLRDATSIDDKGRFNYHLRKLRGYFLAQTEDGYRLTDAGQTLIETVIANDRLLATGAPMENDDSPNG